MSTTSGKVVRLLVVLATVATLSGAQAQPDRGLAHQRAEKLRRGINTSHWFAQVYDPRGYTAEHFRAHTTPEDLKLIRSLGFDHIRLSVEPAPFYRLNTPETLSEMHLTELRRAVEATLAAGLAAVIDIHPSTEYKKRLERDNNEVASFVDFWRALARAFAQHDPERVFFEIMNEPEFDDAHRWMGVQARTAAAIREAAPRHTIIVAGAKWSALEELVALEPLPDPNIIYNFHYYEPHIFTHQGAMWGLMYWNYLRELPYPSTPDAIQPNLAQTRNGVTRLEMVRYGLNRWDARRVEGEIAEAAAWAKRHGVPLVCNEFGVFRTFSRPEHRTAWIRDVRTALEKHGIGWTMWDYSGGFAVVVKEKGKATPDAAVLEALGLRGN